MDSYDNDEEMRACNT